MGTVERGCLWGGVVYIEGYSQERLSMGRGIRRVVKRGGLWRGV